MGIGGRDERLANAPRAVVVSAASDLTPDDGELTHAADGREAPEGRVRVEAGLEPSVPPPEHPDDEDRLEEEEERQLREAEERRLAEEKAKKDAEEAEKLALQKKADEANAAALAARPSMRSVPETTILMPTGFPVVAFIWAIMACSSLWLAMSV